MAAIKKTRNPGEVGHKIVPFNITGAAVKAAGQTSGFESDTTDPAGRYAGFIRGFAGRLMNIDSGLDIIFPGAVGDLSKFAGEAGSGAVAWQHDWTDPIGLPLIAREELAPNWGLYTEARISKTPTGEKCITLVNDKVVKKLSIGYRLKRDGYSIVNREGLVALMRGYHIPIPEDKQRDVLADFDARKLDEVWALTAIDLFEYSPVTFPMNDDAEITGSKDLDSNLGGTLDGLSFQYHPLIVATAVKGLTARLRKFKEIRARDNRKPTQAHVDGLTEVTGELEEAFNEAKTLLSEIQAGGVELTPETKQTEAETAPALISPEESARLYGEFLALESRIENGASLT